jgi:hypothetical protein
MLIGYSDENYALASDGWDNQNSINYSNRKDKRLKLYR